MAKFCQCVWPGCAMLAAFDEKFCGETDDDGHRHTPENYTRISRVKLDDEPRIPRSYGGSG